jgi:hypothetical protein
VTEPRVRAPLPIVFASTIIIRHPSPSYAPACTNDNSQTRLSGLRIRPRPIGPLNSRDDGPPTLRERHRPLPVKSGRRVSARPHPPPYTHRPTWRNCQIDSSISHPCLRAASAVAAGARTPRTAALPVDDGCIDRIVVSHYANARVRLRTPGEQQPRTAPPLSRRCTRACHEPPKSRTPPSLPLSP